MSNIPNAIAASVLDAVRASGRIIKEHWEKPRNIIMKGRIDLVTETDLAVEQDLICRLSSILPESAFLAEESAGNTDLRNAGEWVWIIDPVDGTTNFAHKIPFVASSVALWHNTSQGGEVVLGVVNCPILDECFHATKGGGAFANGNPIQVTQTSDVEQALVATGFPYTIREDRAEIVDWLNQVLPLARGVRRCGAAAVDLAYLAAGRYDAFYETNLKPWDTAAGWLLIEEAGGRVTSLETNGPFGLYERGILASNTKLHEIMYTLLQK